MTPVLHMIIENLERDYWYLSKPLNIKVHAGEGLMVRGNNGSGKTSVLKSIAGLLAYEGHCFVRPTSEALRLKLTGLDGLGSSTVKQHLDLWQKIYNATLENLHDRLILYGLKPYLKTKLCDLSHGLAHRVGLARLGLGYSSMWILDEPFSGLDQDTCHLLHHDISQALQSGKAVLMACHGQFFSFKEIFL